MKKILVFRPGQLGDALVCLPALHAIRESSDSNKVVLLHDLHLKKNYVTPETLLSETGLLDDFLAYPIGYNFPQRIYVLWRLLKLFVRIRLEHFDCVFHLEHETKTKNKLLRDKLFFRLAGIKEQFTTFQFRQAYSKELPLENVEHESDFFLRALRAMGLKVPVAGKGNMNLCMGKRESLEVQKWLEKLGVTKINNSNERILPAASIGVGVGSKMQAKRWPISNFYDVLYRLIQDYDLVPVFFGGSEDYEFAEELIGKLGSGLNACGELSLRGATRALQDCKFYLGNDTGTMHLAVAAGTKCVAIFSARDYPGRWYPYGEGHQIHRYALDCEGCMLYSCYDEKKKCLTKITPDEVYRSCQSILNVTLKASSAKR